MRLRRSEKVVKQRGCDLVLWPAEMRLRSILVAFLYTRLFLVGAAPAVTRGDHHEFRNFLVGNA